MRHFIMVVHPFSGKENEFIGPFKTMEERDKECVELTKKEKEKTERKFNRMSRTPVSYYRTEVHGLIPSEITEKEIKAA